KPQIADVAREGHLRGRDAHGPQLRGQFVLRADPLAANQFQDLALPVRLRHKFISCSLARAAARAAATACGPVPPGNSRDRMPVRGSSSAGSSPSCCISSEVQSAGRLPLRTLSSTNLPTIWWLRWNGVPERASASARSVATTQLSSAAANGFAG